MALRESEDVSDGHVTFLKLPTLVCSTGQAARRKSRPQRPPKKQSSLMLAMLLARRKRNLTNRHMLPRSRQKRAGASTHHGLKLKQLTSAVTHAVVSILHENGRAHAHKDLMRHYTGGQVARSLCEHRKFQRSCAYVP